MNTLIRPPANNLAKIFGIVALMIPLSGFAGEEIDETLEHAGRWSGAG